MESTCEYRDKQLQAPTAVVPRQTSVTMCAFSRRETAKLARCIHVRERSPPWFRTAESLYDMVGLDIFSTEARVGNMASEVGLDSITKDLPEVSIPGVPPLLVINVQLPSAPPALMTSAEDGPGYQVGWCCLLHFRWPRPINLWSERYLLITVRASR